MPLTLVQLGGWGERWIEMPEPLISDQELRRVPDLGTRGEIRQLLARKLAEREPGMGRILELREYVTNRIRALAAAGHVMQVHPHDRDEELVRWQSLDQLCTLVMQERTARAKIDDETVFEYTRRWLCLRMDAIEGLAGRHEVDGYVVDGHLIVGRSR